MEQVWHAKFETSGRPMRRHECWRQLYRNDRYGRYLTQLELNRRFHDLVLNFLVLTPEAKVGLSPMSDAGIRWSRVLLLCGTRNLFETRRLGLGIPQKLPDASRTSSPCASSVADPDVEPVRLHEHFYRAVFDACTLDYSEEQRAGQG